MRFGDTGFYAMFREKAFGPSSFIMADLLQSGSFVYLCTRSWLFKTLAVISMPWHHLISCRVLSCMARLSLMVAWYVILNAQRSLVQ